MKPATRISLFLLILLLVFTSSASSSYSSELGTDLKSDIFDLVEKSGMARAAETALQLLNQAAKGPLPFIEKVKNPLAVQVGADMGPVVKELQGLTQAIYSMAGSGVLGLFDKTRTMIASLPDVEIGWSMGNGRVEAMKRGGDLSVALIYTNGFNRLILGISNLNPLCSYGGGRLGNPIPGTSYAFIDLMKGPYTTFQARIPLTIGLPIIKASTVYDLAGQMYKLDVSALDMVPTKVECEIGLGIEVTFDDILMAEAEAEGKICFETEPQKAWAFAKTAMTAMMRASSGYKKGDKMDMEQASAMLHAGMAALVESLSSSGDELGEIGVQAELTLKAGVGIADSSATAASIKEGLGVMLPVGDAIRFGARQISSVLKSAFRVLPAFQRFAGAGSFGNASEVKRLAKEIGFACRDLIESSFSEALKASSRSKLKLEVSLDALGESGGSSSSTSLKMFIMEAEIPVGSSIAAALNEDFVRECILAMLYLQDQMSPKGISGSRRVAEPNWALFKTVIPRSTTLDIEISPGIPIVTLGAKFPLRAVVSTMETSASSMVSLLRSLPQCVTSGSLKPLSQSAMDAVGGISATLLKEFKEETKFVLQAGGGANVSLGAEAAGDLGLGGKVAVETDLEMLCVLYGKGLDSAGKDGKASLSMVLDFEGEGKVEPGEIVEIEASGGVKTKQKPFVISLKEQDAPEPAPDEVVVAGFLVTGFRGTASADGALNGSGKLHLPFGGTVDAVFNTDAAGKVLKGSWKGTFGIAGRTFTVTSGSIKDDGLHWAANPGLPFVPAAASVEMRLGPRFEMSGSGSVMADLLGQKQAFQIGIDFSTGEFYGAASQSVKLGPWNFANSDIRLDNNGIRGTGDLAMPVGGNTRWNVALSKDGKISGSYDGELKIAGWTFTKAKLSIDNTRISGKASMKLPGTGTELEYSLTVTSDLKLSASAAGSIAYGSWTLADASVSVNEGAFTGRAKVNAPGNLVIDIGLSGTPTSFSGSVMQSFSPFGYTLTNSNLTLSSSKISGSAGVSVPSGTTVSMAFNITPTAFSATATQDMTIMGWNFSSFKLTMTQSSFTGAGKVELPGGSKADASLTFTPTAASGTASLSSGKLLGWTATSIEASFNGNSLQGTANLKLGTTPSFTQKFSVNISKTGISGSATVQGPTLIGWSVSSGSLALNGETVTGSLELTVPGIAKTAFSLSASPTKLDIFYSGAITIMGYNVTDADLRINGSSMSGSFYLEVPGLANTKFTVAASPSKFEATAAGTINVCGWDAADASLKMANSSVTGKGKIDILGVKPQFDFTVTTASASGKYEQDLEITLPGGKKVTLDDAKLTLDTANGMRGTGKLKLANATLTSADFGITKTGGIKGIAYLGLGGNSVKCDFTITSSSLTLTGSMSASAKVTISVPVVSDPEFSLSATVSVGIQNMNELRLTASGTVDAPVISPTSVSGSVDLATGKFSVNIWDHTIDFDLF
ncbi:MAG TPA: hypothetical protein PKJ05_07290 [Bacillota bacterium]|nr:hypothetical protein [Bacillota bacterium]